MWPILELPNLLYSSPHHCSHMFLSFTITAHPFLVSDALMTINLIFFSVFALCLFLFSFFFYFLHVPPSSWSLSFYLWLISFPHHHHHHHPLHHPSLNPVELVFRPSLPSVLQSTCDTLRSHSDSLGFTPNMLPRHPTLGNFEEFACWQHKVGVGAGWHIRGLDSKLWNHVCIEQKTAECTTQKNKTKKTYSRVYQCLNRNRILSSEEKETTSKTELRFNCHVKASVLIYSCFIMWICFSYVVTREYTISDDKCAQRRDSDLCWDELRGTVVLVLLYTNPKRRQKKNTRGLVCVAFRFLICYVSGV